jgi:ABC-type lipoprotein release transport system permease subunit
MEEKGILKGLPNEETNNLKVKLVRPIHRVRTGFFGQIKVIFDYLVDDIQRGPVQFKIAVFSIFIIIAFISILVNARSLMMAMFIGMAEQAVGDTDFYIQTVNSDQNTMGVGDSFREKLYTNFLEVSVVNDRLSKVDDLYGYSPRWLLPGTVSNIKDPNKRTSVFAIMGDSLKENAYGIGRVLQVPALTATDAYIMKSVKNMAELDDDMFDFKLDFIKFLRQVNVLNQSRSGATDDRTYVYEFLEDNLDENITINMPNISLSLGNVSVLPNNSNLENLTLPNVTIQRSSIIDQLTDLILQAFTFQSSYKTRTVIDKPLGKWPETLGNVIFLDSNYFSKIFMDRLTSNIERASNNITDTFFRQFISNDTNATSDSSNQNIFDNPTASFQNQVYQIMRSQINRTFTGPIIDSFNTFNVSNRAMSMCAVVKDKIETYGSFNSYKRKLVQISNRISKELIDIDRYNILAPMYEGFEVLGFVSIFIQNIIYMILVLLAILSVVLLASLMVFSIDEKTYEYGMLRALGFKRNNIVMMLIIQGLIFATCGWCLGILLSWVVAMGLNIFFYLDIRMLTAISYDPTAWVVTVFFGFVIPIAVNMYSIKSSLSNSLRDSLDLYHRTIGTLTVIFVKLEKLGISNTVFVVSIELAVYGFLFYYVAPMLFFYNKFDWFIYLFNSVLLATIISMTVISNILQPYLELAFMKFASLFLKKDKPLETVIRKNLEAHQGANRKTSLMLALCVCFIIFSGSGIHTQVNSIVSQVIIFNGSDLNIESASPTDALEEEKLRAFLDREDTKKFVESYSFITKSFWSYPYVTVVELSPRSFYPVFYATITGVDQNYTKTFYQQYYTPNGYLSDTKYPTLENGVKDGISKIFEDIKPRTMVPKDPNQIYAKKSIDETPEMIDSVVMNAVIPSGLIELTSIDVGVPARLRIVIDDQTILCDFNIVHTADKVPGMQFSKYVLNVQSAHDLMVPMESYAQVIQLFKEKMAMKPIDKYSNFISWENEAAKKSSFGVLKNRMIVKIKEGTTEEERDRVKNGIKNLLKTTDFLSDAISLKNTTERSLKYLSILNVIIAALTCIISFFMLLISLMKKIKDNIWELGVLRSIGLSVNQVKIIYWIETFAVILSSLILGTAVGLLISYIGSIFYFIFFEVNLGIGFPWLEFIVLLVFMLATTYLTGYYGMKGFIYLPISKLLKGLV